MKKQFKQGFTLIEMLVVVLIIGILAGIALPQYQMAVTKAKVASILPLMRRWSDALMEYKLRHGSYLTDNHTYPDGAILGVNWPSDWNVTNSNQTCGDTTDCQNEYWDCRAGTSFGQGEVFCIHFTSDGAFLIVLHQPDYDYGEQIRGLTCQAGGAEAEKVCKQLGGIETNMYDLERVYKLKF